MLYKTLKGLLTLTTKGYFRSIIIKGKENIPSSGPMIFASNHNSAFMDPILLATEIEQSLYFLAKGEVFSSKLASTFFSMINMIPIYRPDFAPEEAFKNKFAFQKCFDHLKKGKTIVIYPEGISKTERRLRPIKTGTARIALGAEDESDFNLGLKIIPVGINYSNPHFFRSKVLINFGTPIDIDAYKEKYRSNHTETVVELTNVLKESIEKCLVIIKDQKSEILIKKIEVLYHSIPHDSAKAEDRALRDFYNSKNIVNALEYYAALRPDAMHDFEVKIDAYLHLLKKHKIKDAQVRRNQISLGLTWKIFYFILGFPLFIYGYLGNIIPYKVSEILNKKILVREDFIGSLKLLVGMLVFLIFHMIQSLIVGYATRYYWGLLVLFSLYPAGIFALKYIQTFDSFKGDINYIKIFVRKSDLITSLKLRRKDLADQLEEGRLLYLAHLKKQKSSSKK